jgi:hypothetical protein
MHRFIRPRSRCVPRVCQTRASAHAPIRARSADTPQGGRRDHHTSPTPPRHGSPVTSHTPGTAPRPAASSTPGEQTSISPDRPPKRSGANTRGSAGPPDAVPLNDEAPRSRTHVIERVTGHERHDLATLGRLGVGTHNTASLLVAAGENIERFRSEAFFAHLCGVAPLPASSGRTVRHRLDHGGNRQANRALHMIASVRRRYCPWTRIYRDRRIQEGKTKTEVIRCLKRYPVRESRSQGPQARRDPSRRVAA